jgi:diadenosine tetraphosphate (Ap4A) HIT family hydrolase
MTDPQVNTEPSSPAGDLRDLCTFCAEIEGRDEHNLLRRLLGPGVGTSYLLAETENFVLIPGVGSLMPGYMLAVPRRHVLSFGHLPLRHAAELDGLLERAERWIQRLHGRGTLMFEHGPASFVERGGSCTDHAHLHVVPSPPGVDLLPGMERDFDVRPGGGVLETTHAQITSGRGPYLFLRQPSGSSYVCDAPKAMSQHLRRDLVAQCGMEGEWDWEVFPGTDQIRETIRSFDG